MILNYAKTQAALLLAGSNGVIPTYFMIGIGSGTILPTQSGLFSPSDKNLLTSVDASVPRKITYIGDWSSVELSGLTISEWGITGSAIGVAGSAYSETVFGGIAFDGTNELQIQETWEVY
jgi:hypothetical protein